MNKGARVAWVLFEMRTLSKAASEKRPDETRKDTSAPGTRVSRREKRETSKKNAGCLLPASFPRSRRQTSGPRKAFCFTHRNFPVGASSAPSFLCAAEMLTGAQQCYREIPVTADDIFFQPYNRPDYFICMAEHEAGETTVFLLNKSEIVFNAAARACAVFLTRIAFCSLRYHFFYNFLLLKSFTALAKIGEQFCKACGSRIVRTLISAVVSNEKEKTSPYDSLLGKYFSTAPSIFQSHFRIQRNSVCISDDF